MQDNYKRGYEAAKADLLGKSKSTLVFNAKPQQKNENEDFFVDDDEW